MTLVPKTTLALAGADLAAETLGSLKRMHATLMIHEILISVTAGETNLYQLQLCTPLPQ
jgi:hypothetical protein